MRREHRQRERVCVLLCVERDDVVAKLERKRLRESVGTKSFNCIFQPEYGMFVYYPNSRCYWFSLAQQGSLREYNLIGNLSLYWLYFSILFVTSIIFIVFVVVVVVLLWGAAHLQQPHSSLLPVVSVDLLRKEPCRILNHFSSHVLLHLRCASLLEREREQQKSHFHFGLLNILPCDWVHVASRHFYSEHETLTAYFAILLLPLALKRCRIWTTRLLVYYTFIASRTLSLSLLSSITFTPITVKKLNASRIIMTPRSQTVIRNRPFAFLERHLNDEILKFIWYQQILRDIFTEKLSSSCL